MLQECKKKKAYKSKSRPPLASSDHDTFPTYRTVLKSSKPVTKDVLLWSEDSIESLKGCFLCTEWDIYYSADIDETTEVIADYVNFCTDNVATKKQVTIYHYNKLYITKDITLY